MVARNRITAAPLWITLSIMLKLYYSDVLWICILLYIKLHCKLKAYTKVHNKSKP